MSFLLDNSYGQGNVLSVLDKIISSSNIPHAFLFSGPQGVGKFNTAFNLAKDLNKSSANSNVLKQIEKLAEPYIKLIVPLPRGKGETNEDSATDKLSKDTLAEIQSEFNKKSQNPFHEILIDGANNIKISSVRDIKKFISINFSDVKSRVIIISDAHLMNDEAQNALLKSLEEPPPGVIFILLTPFHDLLLDTIKSRSWHLHFEPLKTDEVKQVLQKYYGLETEIAEKTAFFSNGSIKTALDLYENDIEFLLEKTIQILRFSLARKYNSAFSVIDEFISSSPKHKLEILIQLITKWLIDVVKQKSGYLELYFDPFKETLIKFNERYKDVSIDKIYSSIDNLSILIKRNVSLNLITMNIIFELASLGLR